MQSKIKQKRMPAEKRRVQIMEETMKLVARKGFDGTKTKDIAAACGVSEAAIFKIFKSKQEILLSGIEYKFGGPKRELIRKVNFDPKKPEIAMRFVANNIFETVENNIDIVKMIILTFLEHPEYIKKHIKKGALLEKKVIMEAMKAGIESRLYKKMDADIAVSLLPIAVIGMVITRVLADGKKTSKKEREKIIDQIIEVYLHGVMKKSPGGGR
ncbi:MAG TPA: TetR/AcrR family transcriptional regulator [Firmicutes bacterium]|nr:TetR/AcrR family transcriptional regulator [Bacillota bacterium]